MLNSVTNDPIDMSNEILDVAMARVEESKDQYHNGTLTANMNENRKRKRGKHKNKKSNDEIKIINKNTKRIKYAKFEFPEYDKSYEYEQQTFGSMNCTLLALNNIFSRVVLTTDDLDEAGERCVVQMEGKGYESEGFYKKAEYKKGKLKPSGCWSINCVVSALKRKFGDEVKIESVEEIDEVLTKAGHYLISIKSNTSMGHMIGVVSFGNADRRGPLMVCDPMKAKHEVMSEEEFIPYSKGGKVKYPNGKKEIAVKFNGMYRAWRITSKFADEEE